MKTSISAPNKKQVILIVSVAVFLFARVLINTDFLTNEEFSNRQYLIFGAITLGLFLTSVAAIILYYAKKINKVC